MDSRSTHTVVIGGGPAGSAAAIELARAGHRTTLIDKVEFPRDKCCGDGLTTSALRELESLGLEPTTVESWHAVADVELVSPSGRHTVLPLPRTGGTFAVVARRRDLDASLLNLAQDAGADVKLGEALTDIRRTPRGARVELADGRFLDADQVIAADGMWSPTRRALGLAQDGYRGDWHAFRQYFENCSGPATERLTVAFEADLLPGYFWAFPLGEGHVNVGFGVQRSPGQSVQSMAQTWRSLLQRPQITELLGPNATPSGRHSAWPIPAQVDRAVLASGAVLFVGDAARATDPMTGEGIGQALLTGRAAATAVLGGGPHADVARRYQDSVRSALVADHRMASILSRALASPSGCELALAAVSASSWTRRNFARWLFEDYQRAIVATPRRWRRGRLSGPGAYTDARRTA